jgi:hypothetical protein
MLSSRLKRRRPRATNPRKKSCQLSKIRFGHRPSSLGCRRLDSGLERGPFPRFLDASFTGSFARGFVSERARLRIVTRADAFPEPRSRRPWRRSPPPCPA